MAQAKKTVKTRAKSGSRRPVGRPRRFSTPAQMEKELREFFDNAVGKDDSGRTVVNYFPTIGWAEKVLGYRHRQYAQLPEFASVTQWAEDMSHAIGEQLALKGDMASPAIKLYLVSKCGYTGDVVKMQTRQEVQAEVDISGVVAAIEKLNDEEESILMHEIRRSLAEEEDEADEE